MIKKLLHFQRHSCHSRSTITLWAKWVLNLKEKQNPATDPFHRNFSRFHWIRFMNPLDSTWLVPHNKCGAKNKKKPKIYACEHPRLYCIFVQICAGIRNVDMILKSNSGRSVIRSWLQLYFNTLSILRIQLLISSLYIYIYYRSRLEPNLDQCGADHIEEVFNFYAFVGIQERIQQTRI